MRIGLLSDAHGNAEGLANCLSLLRRKGAEQIYFLGDAVGYFSGWADVLKLLLENEVECLRGNHDHHALTSNLAEQDMGAYQLLRSYMETIEVYRTWMESWPTERRLLSGGRRVLLVHGSPENPLSGYIYPWSDMAGAFQVDADVVAMGHTHRPFIAAYEGKKLINVGSCGLPRDVGDLSSCAMIDTETDDCEVYRIPFDVTKLLSRVGYVHPDVRACLARSSQEYFGQLVSPSTESSYSNNFL